MTEEQKNSFAVIERCLDRSCDQMEMLLAKISFLEQRLQNAEENQNEAVMKNLTLQLDVLQGVYSMYYSYSEVKATQLMMLSQQISIN